MADYRISGPARQDLREIHDRISRDDRAAADRVLLDLREATTDDPDAPAPGRLLPAARSGRRIVASCHIITSPSSS